MKRISNRKVRLSITLQQLKNGKVVSSTTKQIKDRILQTIKASKTTEFKLKVAYTPTLTNKGHYFSKKDLVFALNAFTAKPQLDFVEDYWKGGDRNV